LGQVNVRKGIHYLIEAARLLLNEPVEFTVAGPIQIQPAIVAGAPGNMTWLGAVPRNLAPELYRQHDVFVLPTLSDGFAITQLEAMAYGVPAVVTLNCGKVIEEGRTGFIIPAQDAHALSDALMNYVRQPTLGVEMTSRCIETAKMFSINSYGKRLIEIINRGQSRRDSSIAYPMLSQVQAA